MDIAARGMLSREIPSYLLLLALVSGCTRHHTEQPAESAPAAGTLEVGLYRLEAGHYTNLTTGEVTLEADEIRAQLADANTADDTFLGMLRGVGGFEKYHHLLDTSTPEELKALHEGYGVGYPDNPPRPSNVRHAR